MSNLYQRMTETLAENMGDTILVMEQFQEAIVRISELEKEKAQVELTLELIKDYQERNYGIKSYVGKLASQALKWSGV